jgi:hypothetical protein
MLRVCYQYLLRFHPARFREHFTEEMLSIFDHIEGRAGRGKLVADAFISLLRQWTMRPQNWGRKQLPAYQSARQPHLPFSRWEISSPAKAHYSTERL